jgi:hypothetical protein
MSPLVPVLTYILIEIVLLLAIRDNMTLILLQLVYPIEK